MFSYLRERERERERERVFLPSIATQSIIDDEGGKNDDHVHNVSPVTEELVPETTMHRLTER